MTEEEFLEAVCTRKNPTVRADTSLLSKVRNLILSYQKTIWIKGWKVKIGRHAGMSGPYLSISAESPNYQKAIAELSSQRLKFYALMDEKRKLESLLRARDKDYYAEYWEKRFRENMNNIIPAVHNIR